MAMAAMANVLNHAVKKMFVTNVKTKLKVDKKSCKKLVNKLYGDERWNEEQFDELIGQGMKGEELLAVLGISKNLHNFK